MAAKEGKQWWDPYETSNKRQFVYCPNSAAKTLLCRSPTSRSFTDSFSQSGPLGSSVYKKDFGLKPVCKPEYICTGTASGQRRNNPHPRQSFMIWKLPREASRSSDYVNLPWKCPPSERVIRQALTAQYCSTYRCDFLGKPQGYDHKGGSLASLYRKPRVLFSTDTEMRDNYRKPTQKSELLDHHRYNTDQACCGIVPAVVQKHVQTQPKRYNSTTYDRFYGKRVSDVKGLLKSLSPQELQQLQNISSVHGQEAIGTALSKDADQHSQQKVNKLPAVAENSCTAEWTSSWPGPQ